MRKFISIFLVLSGLFVFSSCEKDADPSGARLIDENALPEFPVDKLRFKWRGDVGHEQKLMMWISWYTFDKDNLEPPSIYQIGIPKNYTTVDGDLYVFETDVWAPIVNAEYHWKVLTYYSDGEVVSSDTRTFVPSPTY